MISERLENVKILLRLTNLTFLSRMFKVHIKGVNLLAQFFWLKTFLMVNWLNCKIRRTCYNKS